MAEQKEPQENKAYQEYIRQVHRAGTGSMLVLLILTYMPAFYLFLFYDAFPGFGTLAAAVAAMLGIEAYSWILEPIMYLPILGITGAYMGYTSGNIANMRIPAATAAQNIVNAKIGTRKSEMAGVFGIISSVIVNLFVLLIVIVFGEYLLSVLPEIVQESFDYAVPAVYGTLIAMMLKLIFGSKNSSDSE